MRLVKFDESFKIAKMCLVLEQVLDLPAVTLSTLQSEQLMDWIMGALTNTDPLIVTDILSCLATAVNLKEIKQTKVILF